MKTKTSKLVSRINDQVCDLINKKVSDYFDPAVKELQGLAVELKKLEDTNDVVDSFIVVLKNNLMSTHRKSNLLSKKTREELEKYGVGFLFSRLQDIEFDDSKQLMMASEVIDVNGCSILSRNNPVSVRYTPELIKLMEEKIKNEREIEKLKDEIDEIGLKLNPATINSYRASIIEELVNQKLKISVSE